ncbi:MAG: hypothetical protein AB7S26_36755 [Sandaracinaceae bacterium]
MIRAGRVLFTALLVVGCYPDFDRFRVIPEGQDAGDLRRDAGPPVAGNCAPQVTCGDGCPMPWLLAGVEGLEGSACPGMVWRFSLTANDAWCACEPLDASGGIPRVLSTVGFSPPSTVVVAGADDRVVAVDATTDRVTWDASYFGLRPVDVFAMRSPGGTPLVAVASSNPGLDHIAQVALYDASSGGAPRVEYLNQMGLPLGLAVTSMTQSSLDATWLRAVRSDMYAARDVDPNTEMVITPDYVLARPEYPLDSIHSFYDGSLYRTLWTGRDTSGASRIFRIFNADPVSSNTVPLPEECEELPGGGAYDVTCEYIHAVGDPTYNTNAFALCEYDGFARRIVRRRLLGECETLADSALINPNLRISRLSIALPTLWRD